MKRKTILFFISLVLFLFNIFSHGQDCIAEAVSSNFQYVGTDNNDSTWYLDTSSYKYYKYSDYGEIINFDIMTETLRPHKEEIISWLSEALRSQYKANNIYTQTSRMSHHCVYSLEKRKCYIKRIDFYNAKHKLIYSCSLNVIWHPIIKNSPVDIAINYITSALGAEPINSEKMQAKEIFNIVGMSFLIGVIALLLIMPIDDKLSTKHSSTTTHNENNKYSNSGKENHHTEIYENKLEDDFDYPYEDIGDTLK